MRKISKRFFMTIREYSRYSGVSELMLRKMYHNDQLPGFHAGKTFYINAPELCDFFGIAAPTDDTEA